jgi:uncharacterized Fe-S cluster-containing MiaB family protein
VPAAIRIVDKISADKCSVETINVRKVDDGLETGAVIVFGSGRFLDWTECRAQPVNIIVVQRLPAKKQERVLVDGRENRFRHVPIDLRQVYVEDFGTEAF